MHLASLTQDTSSSLSRIAYGVVHQVQKVIFEARWQQHDVGHCEARQITDERRSVWHRIQINCAERLALNNSWQPAGESHVIITRKDPC